MEEKNIVLDIIIEFIKALKTKDKAIEVNINGKMYKIWSCKYLLNQLLRQLHTPKERWYISKKAKELWDKLSPTPIENYHYNDIVQVVSDASIEVEIYKGNDSHFEKRTLKSGDKFKFNSVFHEEHIVPINVIIHKLLELDNLTYANVESILDKIAMCRILKSEDKLLNKQAKKNRPCDAEEVLKRIYYEKTGIEIFVGE